jgi:hypothetical protein
MAQENLEDLATIVHANDKLLKAFITLMAFKDDHLLSELRIVFAAAAASRGGASDDPALAHVRKELSQIGEVVERMEQTQAASGGVQDPH